MVNYEKILKIFLVLRGYFPFSLPFLACPALAQPNDVYGINNVQNGLNNSLPGPGLT